MTQLAQSEILNLKSEISCYPLISSKTCLALTLTLLLTFQIFAQTRPHYESEVRLPMDLYTKEGVLLQTGKFSLEVRLEKGHDSLLFLRQKKAVATVLAQASEDKKEDSRATPLGIPILGTLHLAPVGSLDKEENTKSTASEYFPSLSWKASLRVYKSANPESPEVNFVFLERDSSGKPLRRDFRLFLKKPE